MNKYEFDILLQKYLAGECNDEESREVHIWAENMLLQSRLNLNEKEKARLRRRVWKRLSEGSLGNDGFGKKLFRFSRGIAASLLLLALVTFGLMYKPRTPALSKVPVHQAEDHFISTAEEGVITFQTEEKPQKLTLEDGSIIVLGKGSSIRYPVKFSADIRQVSLEGEAFFKISRDEKKPFLVYSGCLVTEVLGTSFNIRSSPGTGKIEVEVVSGSVSVYENKKGGAGKVEEVILTPNQKVVFERSTKKLVPELVNEPVQSSSPSEEDTRFVFEEVELQKVLENLAESYEVKITLASPAMAGCLFTGDLNGLPLHTQLKMICRSVNGSYEQWGNEYFLKGQGCDAHF